MCFDSQNRRYRPTYKEAIAGILKIPENKYSTRRLKQFYKTLPGAEPKISMIQGVFSEYKLALFC